MTESTMIDTFAQLRSPRIVPSTDGEVAASIEEAVRRRAYEIFSGRGGGGGNELGDWLAAEAELLEPATVETAEDEQGLTLRIFLGMFPEEALEVSAGHDRISVAGILQLDSGRLHDNGCLCGAQSRRFLRRVSVSREFDCAKFKANGANQWLIVSIPRKESTRLRQLEELGQSFWLDFIERGFIESELPQWIEQDGLSGLTSNPTIYKRAIEGSQRYDPEIERATMLGAPDALAVLEDLMLHDAKRAADALRPVFDRTDRADGFVSIEVSPSFANDAEATVREAKRIWTAVERPNLMIKIPANPAGLQAMQTLIEDGINVNVTLLFSVACYRDVAEAFIQAMSRRHARCAELSSVASVASFFVSRIDVAVDRAIQTRLGFATAEEALELESLRSSAGVASARAVFMVFRELFGAARWQTLEQAGARPQRLLWASTSTKTPHLPDTWYVDELIGPSTVNTMTPETATIFKRQGRPRLSLQEGAGEAMSTLSRLTELGVPIDSITGSLFDDGLATFADSFSTSLKLVEAKQTQLK